LGEALSSLDTSFYFNSSGCFKREGWQNEMVKASRECKKDLRYDVSEPMSDWWNSFFGDEENANGINQACLVSELWRHKLRPCDGVVLPTPIEPVQNQTVTASTGQVMRSTLAINEERRPLTRTSQVPSLDKLTSSTFAAVTVEGGFREDSYCIVQLPVFAANVDTTKPELNIKVKWWKPVPNTTSGSHSYAGKWQVWFQESGSRRQYCDEVKRATIAVCPLELTATSVTRALNGQHLKIKRSSPQVIQARHDQ
jgi:hypothetical protein